MWGYPHNSRCGDIPTSRSGGDIPTSIRSAHGIVVGTEATEKPLDAGISRGLAAKHVDNHHARGAYSQVAPELQQEAADRLGRVLWRNTGTPSWSCQDCSHLIMEGAAQLSIMPLTCGDQVGRVGLEPTTQGL